MVPWNKVPRDVQKTVLALLVLSGVSTTASCCGPIVCDPAPPPRTASPIICDPPPPPRSGSPSPIICDPPPTPRTAAPTRTPGPIICDPQPAPSVTRTPGTNNTPAAVRRFRLRSLQMTSDSTLDGAAVRGSVYDQQNQPLGDVPITVKTQGTIIDVRTARNGSFFVRVPNPGSYQLIVGGDQTSALPLELKPHDVANVEWEVMSTSALPLPLAEIRTVDIVWGDGLTFRVDTAWSGARCRWSVSGGTLMEEADDVTWEPPTEPGRYLLQLFADWGYEGLAVDSLVLTVRADGSILVS